MFQPARETYGDLLRRHLSSARDGVKSEQALYWIAIEVMRSIYPTEAQDWESQFGSDK